MVQASLDDLNMGLVTRFTLTPSGAPAMFPVKLRLLSELDIVKILTNTYYADCRHLTPPDEDALAARVDALAKKAKGEPWRASFSEDDDRPEGIRHPEFPGHRRGPEA